MSQFAVVVYNGVGANGMTDEMSVECDSMDDVIMRLKQLQAAAPNWRAVTIVHSEDFPLIMQGARPV